MSIILLYHVYFSSNPKRKQPSSEYSMLLFHLSWHFLLFRSFSISAHIHLSHSKYFMPLLELIRRENHIKYSNWKYNCNDLTNHSLPNVILYMYTKLTILFAWINIKHTKRICKLMANLEICLVYPMNLNIFKYSYYMLFRNLTWAIGIS